MLSEGSLCEHNTQRYRVTRAGRKHLNGIPGINTFEIRESTLSEGDAHKRRGCWYTYYNIIYNNMYLNTVL